MALFLAGFVVLWIVLDRSAAALGSLRGEAGIIVCAIVVAAAVIVEMGVSRCRPLEALAKLGFRLPGRVALVWTLVLGAALLGFYPVFAVVTGVSTEVRPDWYLLLPGLFAQGGIAEETVFRGYLFRHFRQGRSFWRAAVLAAVPFVAVHLVLFHSLEFGVALASLLVAVSLSFPLAWLYERSGNSIWPPAVVHFVVQGSIKLIEVEADAFFAMAIAWMVLSATVPWALFLLVRDRRA